jgi:UDP-3-O-[3-hydroxymyristoyl] glucosamine N-acyltransferase
MVVDASPVEDQAFGRAASLLSSRMSKRSVQEIASAIKARVVGDPTALVSCLASIESARPGALVFADSAQTLERALVSGATAIITGEFAAQQREKKALLIVAHPRLAFALSGKLFEASNGEQGIHRSAVIDALAKLADEVSLGANTVVQEHAVIGEKTFVGANCTIEAGVKIGRDCKIFHNVVIHSGCVLGDRVVIQSGTVLGSAGFGYVKDQESSRYHQFPQIGMLVIEDDVEIGANCTLDRGALDKTVIRRGVKIDNLVHLGHNVEIGENVVMAAQTGISGTSSVGANAILGGQVGIGDHANVEEGVILGGQAGVPSNKVLRGKGILFWGTPARPIREYLKQLAVLARLAKKESK